MSAPSPSTQVTATPAATSTGNPPLGWITGSQYQAITGASTTATTSSPPPVVTTGRGWRGPVGDGSNSQLYLFIFLAAVVLLAVVGCLMIGRAVMNRRRFQRRVAEAIARGETIPQYQNPFYTRPVARKKTKPLPPMPVMWESQMRKMDEKDMEAEGDDWFSPVSINRIYPYVPPEPKPPIEVPAPPTLRTELREALGDMFPRFSRRRRREMQRVPPPRPEPVVEMRTPVVNEAPEVGADLRVGVLIAMPCEGQQLAMWAPDDPVDAEVPEVYVGVMECTASEVRRRSSREG